MLVSNIKLPRSFRFVAWLLPVLLLLASPQQATLTADSNSAIDPPVAAADDTPSPSDDQPLAITSVGLPVELKQIVLPGAELAVRPLADRHEPLILRIAEVFQHGSDHRYDLEFYALEAGRYDLADYLVRGDGEPLDEPLPTLPVQVDATLTAGQIVPNEVDPGPLPQLGGYRLAVLLGIILWVLGLMALIFGGRRRQPVVEVAVAKPVTVADRLRPLIEKARDGKLSAGQQAELERSLISLWVQRLQLTKLPPGEAFQQLKQHPQAGPLLLQLEQWLHCPNPQQQVDMRSLLAPYEQISAAEVEG